MKLTINDIERRLREQSVELTCNVNSLSSLSYGDGCEYYTKEISFISKRIARLSRILTTYNDRVIDEHYGI